jgi:hypothetical protein
MTSEWKPDGLLFNEWLLAVGKRYFTSINGDGFYYNSTGKTQKAVYKKDVEIRKILANGFSNF